MVSKRWPAGVQRTWRLWLIFLIVGLTGGLWPLATHAETADRGEAPMVWPASGPITTHFGEVGPTSPRGHAGLDIGAPWGAPVIASADGTVVVATRNGGPYGQYVVLEHGDGFRTLYAHLSRIDVAAGQAVEQGDGIGRVGSTGYSTGPHLHFEVREDGALRNPLSYLR
jgi:murein DD-endopeptidase MepM/ murein hydrolase activator NlpD